MSQQVVHFEIIGRRPEALQRYYGELFGWSYEPNDAATEKVAAPGQYGFVDAASTGDGTGIPGGVGGGPDLEPQVLFYIGVPSVEGALQEAERLGGRRVFGPEGTPGTFLVGRFTDPEGNLVGVAGTK